MSTSYTSLLGLALPVQGELSGTWGDVVNDSITQLVEDSVAGYATADVTSGNWTLTTTGSGASNQARMAILIPTGTPGVSRNIVAPSQSKAYIVINQSDADVVIKGSATTGVTIATGVQAAVAWDGSDFVLVAQSSSTNGTVTSVSGTGTVNGISLSGTVTSSGNITLGGALTGVNLASQVTGTLPAANGGTGVTSLGTGVATALGQNVSGSGSITLNNAPTITSATMVTPALGTPASGTLTSCTVDGTNSVGYKNIPSSGTKTSAYTLQTTDVGKYIQVGTGGSIEIPDATFSNGDAVSIFNNTSGSITITCTITTAYIAGTDTDKASVTLSTRGLATILFASGTVCVISGNVA